MYFKIMDSRLSKIYCCLSLAILGVLVYGNHLNNTFQFDSVAYIENNLLLKNPESIINLNYWISGFFSRGLLFISMAINAYFDGLRPFGYHIFNLFLHILNSILVFFIFKKILIHFKNHIYSIKNNTNISFFAATVFLIHPIQTESVIYIISRSEILASTFYLLGFLLFQVFIDLKTKKNILTGSFIFILIIFLAVVGFSVKQTLATFPLVLFLYYLAVCPIDAPIIKILFIKRKLLITGFVVSLSILFYKLLNDETFLIGPSNPDEMVGRVKYMLSQPAVIIFYYLKKIFLPINLNIDPDIKVITSIFSFGFISGMGCIILLIYYFWKQDAWRFYLFCLAWFFIILSPSSSIVTLHDLAAEHRVYLALPGVIFIFSYGISCFLKNQTGVRLIGTSVLEVMVFIQIILLFSVLSIERNRVWRSELSLWQDSHRKSPDKIRPLINLARAHSIEGNNRDAIRYYEESLLKAPGIFVPNYNLGELYLKENRIEEAIIKFKIALQLDPKIPETYAKLGEVYLKQKKWQLADVYFKKCIEIDNRFPNVFKNLGIIHFYHLKNLKESLIYFSKSLDLDPNQKDAEKIRKLIFIYQKNNSNL